MSERPYALAISGFDPTGGAGVLADIKTMEALGVQGLAALTARTIQTEKAFIDCQWERISRIVETIKELTGSYEIRAIKIGIMPSAVPLMRLIRYLHERLPNTPLVIDPVMHPSSSDYTFLGNLTMNLLRILHPIDLLTPNSIEYATLIAPLFHKDEYPICSNILVTGGHDVYNTHEIKDVLYTPNGQYQFTTQRVEGSKHGTGCIYSSAVAANLALGKLLLESCKLAQQYVVRYIASSPNLLGHHF